MAIVVVLSAGAAAFSITVGVSLWLRRLCAVWLAKRFTSVYVFTLAAGMLISMFLAFAQELVRETMVNATVSLHLWRFKRLNVYCV